MRSQPKRVVISRIYGKKPQRSKAPSLYIPCIHEGPIIEWATCGNCESKHVRSCDLHDTCTRGANNGRISACSSCKDYEKPPTSASIGAIRNLLYYVYPVTQNGVWQRNADQLLRRIDLFNGRRIIAVSVRGPHGSARQRLDPPEAVHEKFAGHGCEFITVANDKRLGEVVAWRPLWERVLPGSPDDVTFYGHAKGVTRPLHSTTHRWTEILYETSLDYWPLVQQQLREFPLTGSFKKLGFCFPGVPSQWHYSGTFVWHRNADLAARSWQNPPRQWAGTEALPGILYKPDEGGCLFHTAFGTVLNAYSVDYMARVIEPEYLKWKEANGAYRVQDVQRIPADAVPA